VGNGFACGIARAVEGVVEREALCWGAHDASQLGRAGGLGNGSLTICADTSGDSTITCTFNPLRAADGLAFSALSSGGPNTCGVSNLRVYCWGGSYGESPQRINVPPGTQVDIDSISVGGGLIEFRGSAEPFIQGNERPLACALSVEGQAFCWGDNTHGELGSGEEPIPGTPIEHRDQMQKVAQGTLVFDAVSAGARLVTLRPPDTIAHACALTQDGAIFCWGSNRSGALGVSGLDSTPKPRRVEEPES
jgi:alpha-tubulin suppressor-like RCC1 family protein